MTTTVTVMTHDWPVEVHRVNPETSEPIMPPETVPPQSNFNFYLSNTMALALRELPKP